MGYCAQHIRLKCGVKGYREREIGLHHPVQDTVRNPSPNGAKQKPILPSLAQGSPPSSGIRVSRKRARHINITSTDSKRVVARELTGGAVTMPEIDGRKPPVQRDSSMKTEVQLSW